MLWKIVWAKYSCISFDSVYHYHYLQFYYFHQLLTKYQIQIAQILNHFFVDNQSFQLAFK